MNISKKLLKLLFSRVGFTPATLQLLCNHIEHKQITDRTARRWASGEVRPRNDYYIKCALALDEHLTTKAFKALAVIHKHTGQHEPNRLILPYYATDDDYWTATNDMPCPVSVYHQLLQRIEVLSSQPMPIFYLDEDRIDDELQYELRRDWDNYINLSVDFNFTLNDPFAMSVDDDSDL